MSRQRSLAGLTLLATCGAAILGVSEVNAATTGRFFIGLDWISAPSGFGGVAYAPIKVPKEGFGSVTLSGGTPLTAATNLPRDRSTVYGRADRGTIEVAFSAPASHVALLVLNGWIRPQRYIVTDDKGDRVAVTIAANSDSGGARVVLPSPSVSQVKITSPTSPDFLIDRIEFLAG